MEFSANNLIVKLCIQGMDMEAKGKAKEAEDFFLQAWDEATNDFEKFLAAHYISRQHKDPHNKLKWLETSLQFALKANNSAIDAALSPLYLNIAKCYEELNDAENARKNHALAISAEDKLSDKGPFYHGTKADLKVGDMLTTGYTSNYNPELTMNHIYFTALVNGAGLAAALSQGAGREHVYIVKPTGPFENDPNVTNKKFPGNPTRSYRSSAPLKIIGEATDWIRPSEQELKMWRERLANTDKDLKGKIIN